MVYRVCSCLTQCSHCNYNNNGAQARNNYNNERNNAHHFDAINAQHEPARGVADDHLQFPEGGERRDQNRAHAMMWWWQVENRRS
jgi:hypothetical protein